MPKGEIECETCPVYQAGISLGNISARQGKIRELAGRESRSLTPTERVEIDNLADQALRLYRTQSSLTRCDGCEF